MTTEREDVATVSGVWPKPAVEDGTTTRSRRDVLRVRLVIEYTPWRCPECGALFFACGCDEAGSGATNATQPWDRITSKETET